jgi:hypothetical protein
MSDALATGFLIIAFDLGQPETYVSRRFHDNSLSTVFFVHTFRFLHDMHAPTGVFFEDVVGVVTAVDA